MIRLVGLATAGVATLGAAASASPGSAQPPAAAGPQIAIYSPRNGASYEHGSRIVARFHCSEGGLAAAIVKCRATVPRGHAIDTKSIGTSRFTVTATDRSGKTTEKTVRYTVWAYTNPSRTSPG